MKLKTTKRIFCMLSCLLVCALLSCTALAGEAEWSLSYDEETLTYATYTFTLYEPFFPVQLVGDVVYRNNYALDDYRSVDANAEHSPTYAAIYEQLYVTEAGGEALDRLMEGEASSYMLMTQYGACAPISRELVTKLTQPEKGAETRTFDVRDLEDKVYYTLLGVESYGYYGCAYGAVYMYAGEFYYIHYMDLGNQYFDAYGNFSYRRGTVEAVKLSVDFIPALVNVEQDATYRPLEYIDVGDSGSSGAHGNSDLSSSRSAFTTGMVVFGFLIPTPLLIVGLTFPRSEKRGYPKYWYILAGIAALWMLLSALLMAIVL